MSIDISLVRVYNVVMFDTHAHLTDEKYDNDREEMYSRFLACTNPQAVVIGCDMDEIPGAIAFARAHDELHYAIGIHPAYIDKYDEAEFMKFVDITDDKLVAIGEIGLDYYEGNPDKELQKQVFDQQIKLAKRLGLPFCVHCRDAYGDCLEVLKNNAPFTHGGIMHCYSGSAEWANEVLKMGMYISFSGNVTFKNAGRLREVAVTIPLDRILVETDCPYLSPEGKRGQRNEPANVAYVVDMLAKLHNVSYEEMLKITDDNAKRVYRIK
ncbi:MAG: TatD family hydrolase [Clostridia bacterium]|nr:TatD family hydrolase [Clostridia bacterium]